MLTVSSIREAWRERLVYLLRFLQLRSRMDHDNLLSWRSAQWYRAALESIEVTVYDADDGRQLRGLARQAFARMMAEWGMPIRYHGDAWEPEEGDNVPF